MFLIEKIRVYIHFISEELTSIVQHLSSSPQVSCTPLHQSDLVLIYNLLIRTCLHATLRSYETSKLYRDLKLRGSVVREGDLILLPNEEVYSKVCNELQEHMSCISSILFLIEICLVRWLACGIYLPIKEILGLFS